MLPINPRSPFRLLLVAALFLGLAGWQTARAATLNVHDSGATGDGSTDDTAAIQKAIDAAATAGGGTVDFPKGTYITGSIELKSHVTLNVETGAEIHGSGKAEEYPIVKARWEGLEHDCHQALIFANNAEDIAITGSGSIMGSGKVGKLRNPRGATLFEPTNCKNIRIDGVTVGNDGVWTLHPTYCQDIKITNVTIASTGGNSDGFDPDSCDGAIVDNTSFSAGDDDIAIKSGKGQEGVKVGKPTKNITIKNCTFTKGHGGVSLGSELSGGIENVTISNCSFAGVKEALNIKSAPGRAGYVKNIQADHVTLNDVPLLVINTTYHSNPDSQGVPGDAGLTSFSDISVTGVTGHGNSKEMVRVEATPEQPVVGLTLADIAGTSERGFIIANAKNVVVKNITVTGIKGPEFLTQNAEGTGLDGAAPYVPKETAAKETAPNP